MELLHQSILTIVEEGIDQLNLFGNEDFNMELKYPRRQTRKIGTKVFEIVEPDTHVSSRMQNIRSSNCSIEVLLEAELIRNQIVYTKPTTLIEELDGKPDFVIPRSKISIFCDGEFWHGKSYEPAKIKKNGEFWDAKIEKNVLRDEKVSYQLSKNGWIVIRFWENDIKNNIEYCTRQILKAIKESTERRKYVFNFVDLFAGIGGFRIPLEELGGKCLGFSEIDKNSIKVYKKNFYNFENESESELGDVTKLGKLPFREIDLIVGGVPCQAWSVAGKMKGFDDPRGKLWDDSIRIVKLNQPKAFIFENVKGLKDPRNKQSLQLILSSLRAAGYYLPEPELMNSYDFGLPQNRDRILIVGVRKDLAGLFRNFQYPNPIDKKSYLKDIIGGIKSDGVINKNLNSELIHGEKVPYGITRFQNINSLNEFFVFCDTRNGHTTIHSWDLLKTTKREKDICLMLLKNRRKRIYGNSDGNPLSFKHLKELIPDLKIQELEKLVTKRILRQVEGIGFEFVNSKNSSGINGIYRIYLPHSNIFSTLTATGTKDMVSLIDIHAKTPREYREKFISEIVKKKKFREITSKEAGKLQGFPLWFSVHEDERYAKKQFGNAVSTSVIFHLAKTIVDTNIFENESTRKGRNPGKIQKLV